MASKDENRWRTRNHLDNISQSFDYASKEEAMAEKSFLNFESKSRLTAQAGVLGAIVISTAAFLYAVSSNNNSSVAGLTSQLKTIESQIDSLKKDLGKLQANQKVLAQVQSDVEKLRLDISKTSLADLKKQLESIGARVKNLESSKN